MGCKPPYPSHRECIAPVQFRIVSCPNGYLSREPLRRMKYGVSLWLTNDLTGNSGAVSAWTLAMVRLFRGGHCTNMQFECSRVVTALVSCPNGCLLREPLRRMKASVSLQSRSGDHGIGRETDSQQTMQGAREGSTVPCVLPNRGITKTACRRPQSLPKAPSAPHARLPRCRSRRDPRWPPARACGDRCGPLGPLSGLDGSATRHAVEALRGWCVVRRGA